MTTVTAVPIEASIASTQLSKEFFNKLTHSNHQLTLSLNAQNTFRPLTQQQQSTNLSSSLSTLPITTSFSTLQTAKIDDEHKVSIKDLCNEDKARIGNLIKELAK